MSLLLSNISLVVKIFKNNIGLSRDTTTESMRAYFESFGEVKDAVVKIDANTGASRGFGFVIFANEASIDAVFASGSHEIDGKKVT